MLESLEEELNIIEASKLVGNSDYLNSKEYYDKSRLRAKIIKQIKNLKNEINDFDSIED